MARTGHTEEGGGSAVYFGSTPGLIQSAGSEDDSKTKNYFYFSRLGGPSAIAHRTHHTSPLQQGVLTCSLVSWCHPRLHDSNILRSAMGFLNINSSGWSHFGSLLPENGAMFAQNTLCWVQFSLSSRSHSHSTSFSLGLVVIPNHHVSWANSAPSEYWQWENNWTSCATVSWLHYRERFIIWLSENAWCRFDIWVISIRLYSSKLICL